MANRSYDRLKRNMNRATAAVGTVLAAGTLAVLATAEQAVAAVRPAESVTLKSPRAHPESAGEAVNRQAERDFTGLARMVVGRAIHVQANGAEATFTNLVTAPNQSGGRGAYVFVAREPYRPDGPAPRRVSVLTAEEGRAARPKGGHDTAGFASNVKPFTELTARRTKDHGWEIFDTTETDGRSVTSRAGALHASGHMVRLTLGDLDGFVEQFEDMMADSSLPSPTEPRPLVIADHRQPVGYADTSAG